MEVQEVKISKKKDSIDKLNRFVNMSFNKDCTVSLPTGSYSSNIYIVGSNKGVMFAPLVNSKVDTPIEVNPGALVRIKGTGGNLNVVIQEGKFIIP